MKKTYITPFAKEEKLRCKRIICDVWTGSTDGIHPEQGKQTFGSTDDYDDNPNTSEIYSKERSDNGPWESIW